MAYFKKVQQYQFQKVIGSGSFAIVYLGFDEIKQLQVAIKEINLEKYDSESPETQKQMECFESEMDILKNIKHPNIIELQNIIRTPNFLYMIFEYCSNGDLDRFLKKQPKQRISETEAQPIFKQILGAIQVMYKQQIVHRDLKLANILINAEMSIKIADFGFAKISQQQNSLMASYCGTPLTMAPEVLCNIKYDSKCDIWSLGVILYQTLFGIPPFLPTKPDILMLIEVIKTKKLEFLADQPISAELKDLLQKMLVVEPKNRMSFEDLFSHNWVQDDLSQMQSIKKSRTVIERGLRKQSKSKEQSLIEQIGQQVAIKINQKNKLIGELQNLTKLLEDKQLKNECEYFVQRIMKELRDLQITIESNEKIKRPEEIKNVFDVKRELFFFLIDLYQAYLGNRVLSSCIVHMWNLMNNLRELKLSNTITIRIPEISESQMEQITDEIGKQMTQDLREIPEIGDSKQYTIEIIQMQLDEDMILVLYQMLEIKYKMTQMVYQ